MQHYLNTLWNSLVCMGFLDMPPNFKAWKEIDAYYLRLMTWWQPYCYRLWMTNDALASSNGERTGTKEGTSEYLNRKLQDMKWFVLSIKLPRLDHSSLAEQAYTNGLETTIFQTLSTNYYQLSLDLETLDNITQTGQLCCYMKSTL